MRLLCRRATESGAALSDSMSPANPEDLIFQIPELLADARTIEILRTLAGGPLQPTQIEQHVGTSRSTMHARLQKLVKVGLASQRERARMPRLVEYALTDDGRIATARAIITNRRQRRQLAADGHEPGEELHDLLGLLAPVSRLSKRVAGTCGLQKRREARSALMVRLLAKGGLLRPCEKDGRPSPKAKITATSAAWDDALLSGRIEELDISGDHELAGAVLEALCETLR